MRDRSEQILRIACLTLAALVVLQLVHAGFQVNPLMGVKTPAVPALETNANSTASSTPKLRPPTTNSANASAATNKMMSSASTNSATVQMSAGTNLITTNAMAQTATNDNASAETNISTASASETNSSNTNAEAVSTNLMTVETGAGTNIVSTNAVAQTSLTNNQPAAGTNSDVTGAVKISGNHLPPTMAMAGGMRMGGVPMMPGMPGNAPKLPPEIQARVDEIVNSEIFAPVMHPMPAGLLGIAGDTVFLRSASGQTGLVKEGESLDDMKLLKIGINRVLVEQDGQTNELMIFNGFGGDSLLTNQDEISK